MFCEVLLYSGKKEFYKREGKSNVKRGGKKTREKRAEEKCGKEIEEKYLSGVRLMYFTIFRVIFDILQIWMWT